MDAGPPAGPARRPRVAVDAMGGDDAPGVVIQGAIDAARTERLALVLVGPGPRVEAELAGHGRSGLDVTVVDAPDVVTMAESPRLAFRRKPRSSVRVAAELVAAGRADAVFSAGHSGAAVLAAQSAFGLLPRVTRPALVVTVPTVAGLSLLLDAGANLECRPQHLAEFGRLGAAYATVLFGIERPRIGLLSIGEEPGKGTGLICEAHARLAATSLNFIGNVEARDLFLGRADVVVCDGFTGNIALKVGEGLVEAIGGMLRAEFEQAPGPAATAREMFARLRQRVDASEHGAAPLVGVRGLMLVGHGRSSARAVAAGVTTAARLAEADVAGRLTAVWAEGA